MDDARWATFDCYGTLVDWNAGIGDAPEFEAGHHVGARRAPWHQAVALEHVAGSAVDALQPFAEDTDLARRRLQQACRHVQQI